MSYYSYVNLKLLVVSVMDFSIANDLFLVFCFFLYNDFSFHKISNNKLFIVYRSIKMLLHIYNLYSLKRVDIGVPMSLKYYYAN